MTKIIEKTYNLMGGEFYISLQLNSNKLKYLEEEIFEFIFQKASSLINIFNFYDENSKLSKLNKFREISYDKELVFLILESIKFYELSKGKFNISLGDKIKRRKNNKSFILENSFKFNYLDNLIQIDKEKNFIKFNNQLENSIILDLGGIAKGFIIDKVLEETINKYGKLIRNIFIDARGDMVFNCKDEQEIGIENPFKSDLLIDEYFFMKKGSIVTSGHNKQYFKEGSHIIGNESDIKTITLKSEKRKTYELDALATYLIQLKSQEVLELISFSENFLDIDCFLILNNGKILNSL